MDDVNELIEQAKQIGLIDTKIHSALPNATKCSTLQDIQASYQDEDRRVSLKFEDIDGMIYLYLMCICVTLVSMVVEVSFKHPIKNVQLNSIDSGMYQSKQPNRIFGWLAGVD